MAKRVTRATHLWPIQGTKWVLIVTPTGLALAPRGQIFEITSDGRVLDEGLSDAPGPK